MAKGSNKDAKAAGGILLFGGLLTGAYFLFKKSNAVNHIDYELKGLSFNRIKNITEIFALKLNLDIEIENPTATSLKFQSFIGSAYLQGRQVGKFKVYEPITIAPRTKTLVTVPVTADSATILTTLWQSMKTGENKTVNIKGLLKVGPFEIPIDKDVLVQKDV